MADNSPQLKSPLISQSRQDETGSPSSTGTGSVAAVTMNGLDTVVVDSSLAAAAPRSQQLSQQKQQQSQYRGMWRLSYKDFISGKVGKHKFSDLVSKANDWLKTSPEVRIGSCETVTWMDKDERRLGDSELMLMTRRIADNCTTYHQRGLRLWLQPATDSDPHSKKLCYCDIIPDKTTDTVKHLVERINRRIDDYQLRGKIVSIQTLWVTSLDSKLDSEVIKWLETETLHLRRAFILRVFYMDEENTKDTVVLKDIIPQPLSEGGYQDFDRLIDTANSWLKEQKDIGLLNMQSVLVQKKQGDSTEPGNSCYFEIPGPQTSSNHAPVEFIRILRLVCCKRKHGRGPDGDKLCPLSFETFTPDCIQIQESGRKTSRRERIEKMREVFKKAEDFIHSSACDIVNAETVVNPMHVATDTDETIPQIKWLFTLRLYFTSQSPKLKLEEPNFQRDGMRGSFRHSGRRKKPDPENPRRGPIFLRNVVNRQYRYRWVIVAVVAFVAMSLIVALSVIYANNLL